jgi:hypothetical protein
MYNYLLNFPHFFCSSYLAFLHPTRAQIFAYAVHRAERAKQNEIIYTR